MKLKLVNPKRLVLSICVFIGVVSSILLLSTNSLSHTEIKYKTLVVVYGDTLWNIASTEKSYNSYYESKDVRFIIEDIKKVNKMNNVNLSAGEILNIPTYL